MQGALNISLLAIQGRSHISQGLFPTGDYITNLMFALSSDKNQRKNHFRVRVRFLNVNEP